MSMPPKLKPRSPLEIAKERFEIGDLVYACKDLGDEASEDGPGGTYAPKDTELIIRGFSPYDTSQFPIHVSHEHITDTTFGVHAEEICKTPPIRRYGDV